MKKVNQTGLDELSQEEVKKIQGGGEDIPIPPQLQKILDALSHLRIR
jgi:hypothetical protein